MRSNSANPSASSSRLTWLLTADCVRPIRSPAAAKVPWRQTAMKVLSSLIMNRASQESMQGSMIHRASYASIGLSLGLAQAAFVKALAGSPTFELCGGMGCMNHLS